MEKFKKIRVKNIMYVTVLKTVQFGVENIS